MGFEQITMLGTAESQLFWTGFIIFIAGWLAYGLGYIPHRKRLPHDFKDELVSIDPVIDRQMVLEEDGSPLLDEVGDAVFIHTTYRNMLFPVPVHSHVSWDILVEQGEFHFEIVPYVGYPPPVPHGTWRSPRMFSKKLSAAEFSKSPYKDQLSLHAATYVFTFDTKARGEPPPFRAKVTITGEFDDYWMGLRELGRTLVIVGMPLMITALTFLLRS